MDEWDLEPEACCLLDRELSALRPDSQLYERCDERRDERRGSRVPTERTRRSEVLPAFCKPIMVTSISVALDAVSFRPAHIRRMQLGHGRAMWTTRMERGNSPESPEQPLVHLTE